MTRKLLHEKQRLKTNSSGPVAQLERRVANSNKSLVQGLGSHNERMLRETAAEIKAAGDAGFASDRNIGSALAEFLEVVAS